MRQPLLSMLTFSKTMTLLFSEFVCVCVCVHVCVHVCMCMCACVCRGMHCGPWWAQIAAPLAMHEQ